MHKVMDRALGEAAVMSGVYGLTHKQWTKNNEDIFTKCERHSLD